MKLGEAFPFYDDLIGPVHNRYLCDATLQPGDQEVALDVSWGLKVAGSDPLLEMAEQDLREFLQTGMGVRIAENASPSGGEILFKVDPTVATDNHEAHRVDVQPGRITVTGASPVGVLRGVVFLEDTMRSRRAPFLPLGVVDRSPIFQRRIHRSCMSPFLVEELTGFSGPPLTHDEPAHPIDYRAWHHEDAGADGFYHDGMLRRMVHHGINGIWLRGALCLFSKCDAFPEFGQDSDRILDSLRGLCERAARLGISVYVFFNEPLGYPADSDFWDRYPQCKGSYVSYFDRYCLCTSAPETKAFLHDGMAYLFKQVPALGGVILISASEFPSHCYCHIPTQGDTPLNDLVSKGTLCPRCAKREAQEVVGEVITLIREGARSSSPTAEVIAWNWSWSLYEKDPQEGILQRLPEDVILMGDFERGIQTSTVGFDYLNDEYSLKIIGPSDRFKGVASFAQKHRRKVFAKIQIGTTHENATVPYLPTLARVASKYRALNEAGVQGLMNCWNFGNMLSLTTELAGDLAWSPQPTDLDRVLLNLATRHFGRQAASKVVEGWKLLSEAMEDFPGSIPVLYNGPVNRGPVLPFLLDKVNKSFPHSWLPDLDIEGDDLNSWVSPFGPGQIIKSFRSLAGRWQKGVDVMRSALDLASGEDRAALQKELGVAQFCALQFRCTANITDFYVTRDRYHDPEDPSEREASKQRMISLMTDEQQNCRDALTLVEADPRLGFHGEAYTYLVTGDGIRAKLEQLKQAVEVLQASSPSN